jgi:hypothetical protein
MENAIVLPVTQSNESQMGKRCLKKHNTNTLDIFGHNSTDTGVEGWYSPLPRDMTVTQWHIPPQKAEDGLQ